MNKKLSRRDLLKLGGFGLLSAAGGVVAFNNVNASHNHPLQAETPTPGTSHQHDGTGHGLPGAGDVDHEKNGFNPGEILYDFDYGKVSTLPNGQTLREYEIVVINKNIEVVPGIEFPAWTYNGRIPGPTLRATEGDRVRIRMVNGSSHPHSMHFHGYHPSEMDGVPGTGPGGMVQPGQEFTYEFDAEPYGLHLYHCHVFPLARHIAKGLYGAFIVDPKEARPKVDKEMVMVMHGIDIDFDDANDFYAVNGIPFYYQNHPIQIKVGESVRIYLVNILEFDLAKLISSSCKLFSLLSHWHKSHAICIYRHNHSRSSRARHS